MINTENGAIKIGHDTIVDKDYTLDMFKKSHFYDGQDGIRIIDLEEIQLIDGKKYIVSLFFREGKIYMISLINCDKEISQEDEYLRKDTQDKILIQVGIKSGAVYSWGKIISEYDKRSGVSSIDIYYGYTLGLPNK